MLANLPTAAPLPPSQAVAGRTLHAQVLLVGIAVALLTLSAKIQIAWWPVPMTLQTYVVLVIGMTYGTRLGLAAIVSYVVAGALGLPVFAGTPEKGVGLAYIAGPTGGYLAGFIASVVVCGKLADKGWTSRFWPRIATLVLGHATIFVFGIVWLGNFVGAERAVALGFVPFIGATIAKTLLAVVTVPAARRLVARSGG
ncbi:MAG: biotin transporter BioY [Burkholderiales bacterium]|nr:biotin transporter BioY [Burkholderiales bacterium]